MRYSLKWDGKLRCKRIWQGKTRHLGLRKLIKMKDRRRGLHVQKSGNDINKFRQSRKKGNHMRLRLSWCVRWYLKFDTALIIETIPLLDCDKKWGRQWRTLLKQQGTNRKIFHKINEVLMLPVTGKRKKTLNLAVFRRIVGSEARAVWKRVRVVSEIYSWESGTRTLDDTWERPGH